MNTAANSSGHRAADSCLLLCAYTNSEQRQNHQFVTVTTVKSAKYRKRKDPNPPTIEEKYCYKYIYILSS